MMVRMAKWILVGVSIAVLSAGCESMEESLQLKKPSAKLLGVQFKEADLYGATLVFDVQILNNYAFDMPLLSFSYAVSSRGQRFLAGSRELEVKVPGSASEVVSLPARVNYLSALKVLGGVTPGATIPYEAELDVVIKTPRLGSLTLPVGKTGQLALPAVTGSVE